MAVRHFFYAASPSATVTNKPFILTISCLRNGRQYHTFSIYAKISADKIKRRQNARTAVDKVTLESDSAVMPQEAKVSISANFHLESSGADSSSGFIFRVETKGGVRSAREGQHYVLLQRNACYGVDVPDATEIVDITLTMPQGKKETDVQSLKLVHWRLGERAPSWSRAAAEAESLAVRPSTSFPKRVDTAAVATPLPLPLPPSSSGLNMTPLGRNNASSSLLTDLLLPPMASSCSTPGFNSAPALSAAAVSIPPPAAVPGFGFNNQFSDPFSFSQSDLDSSLSFEHPFLNSFVPSLTNTVPSFGGLDIDNALDADEKEFLAHSSQALTSTLSAPFAAAGLTGKDGCSLSDGFLSDASSPSLSPIPVSGKSAKTGAISTPSDYSEVSSPNFEEHSVVDSASTYSHLPFPAHRLPSHDTVMIPVIPAVESHSLSALSPSIASSSSSSNSKRKRNIQPKRRWMMAPRHWNITSRRAPFRSTLTAPERLEGHAVSIVFGGETLDASRLDVNGRTCIVEIPEWQGNVPTVSSIEVDVEIIVDGESKYGTTFVYILSPSATADADNSDESEDDDESDDSDESGDRDRRGGGPSGKRQKGSGNGNGSVRLFASFDSLSSFKGFFSNQALQSGFSDMVQSYLNGKFTIDDLESARSLMETQATAAFTTEKQLASSWQLKETQAVAACTSDKNQFTSSRAPVGSDGPTAVMAQAKHQPPPFRDKSRSSDETGAQGTNMDVDSSADAERVDPSTARALQQQISAVSRCEKAADERGRLFVLCAQRNQMRAFISHALKEIASFKQASGQVNELDQRGFSIVHYVAALGEPSLLQRLVSAGADVNLTGDVEAYSALDLAKQRFVMVHAAWDQLQKQRSQGSAADGPVMKSAEDQYMKMTQVLKILKDAGAYERTAIPAQARPFLQALLQLRSAMHSAQRAPAVVEPSKAAFAAVAKSDAGFKPHSSAASLPSTARGLAELPPESVWKAVLGQLQEFMEQQDAQPQQQFVAPVPRAPKQTQLQSQTQTQLQSQLQPFSQFCAATSSGDVEPQVPTAPFKALPSPQDQQPSDPPIQSQSLVQPQAMSAFQKQVFGLAASDPLWQQIVRFIQLLPPVVPPLISASASSSSSSSFVPVTSSSLDNSVAPVQSASARAQALLEQLRGVLASYLAARTSTAPVTQQLAALRLDNDSSSGQQRQASAFAVCQRSVFESQLGAGSRSASSEPLFLKVRTVFADLVPARKFFSSNHDPAPAVSLIGDEAKSSSRDVSGVPPSKEQRRALCIGVNSYVGPSAGSLPSLRGCVNDAHKFAAVLREKYQFDNVVVLVDNLASRRSILEQLEALVRQSQRGDVAVLYFAGHGSANGIVCHDGAVSMEELQRLISQCVTPHVVFVVDACSSSKPPLSADSGNSPTCIRGVELTVLDRSPMVRHSSLDGAGCVATCSGPPNLVRAWSFPSRESACVTQVMSPGTSCGVLAAACGPLQVAKEKQFDGAWHGIFTHYLCEELCLLGTDRSESPASPSTEGLVDLPAPASAAGSTSTKSSNETLLRLVLSKQPDVKDELGDHMFRPFPTENNPHLGVSSTISGAELAGEHFRSLEKPTPPVPPDLNAIVTQDERPASAAAVCPLSDATLVAQVFDRVARKVCAVSHGAQNPKVYTASRSGSPSGANEDSPRSPAAIASGERPSSCVPTSKLPGTTSAAANLAAVDVCIDSDNDEPEAAWIQIGRGGQKLQVPQGLQEATAAVAAAAERSQRMLKSSRAPIKQEQVPASALENAQVTIELPRKSLDKAAPSLSSANDDSAATNKRRNKKRNKKSWTAVAAAASSHATTTAAALATTAAPLTATTSATSSLLGIPFSQVLLSLTLYVSLIAVVAALVCWLSPQASASTASFISLPLVPFRIAFPALFASPPASESSSRLSLSSILSGPPVTVTGLNAPLDWSKSAQYFSPDVLDAIHRRLPSDLIPSAAPSNPSIPPGDPPKTQHRLPSTFSAPSEHEPGASSSASSVLSSSALALSTPLAAVAVPIPCALSVWAHQSDPPIGQASASAPGSSQPGGRSGASAPELASVPSPHAESAAGGSESSASAHHGSWIRAGASAICTAISPSPLCVSSAAATVAATPSFLSSSDRSDQRSTQDSKPRMVSISTQTDDLPGPEAPATVLRGVHLDDWCIAEGDQPGAPEELASEASEGSVEDLEGFPSPPASAQGAEGEQVPRFEAHAETADVSLILSGWSVDIHPTPAVSTSAAVPTGTQLPPNMAPCVEHALTSAQSTQDSPIVLLSVAELDVDSQTIQGSPSTEFGGAASDKVRTSSIDDLGAANTAAPTDPVNSHPDTLLSPCPSPFAANSESSETLLLQPNAASEAVSPSMSPSPTGSPQLSASASASVVALPLSEHARSYWGRQPPLPDGNKVQLSRSVEPQVSSNQAPAVPSAQQQRLSPRHLSKVLRDAITGLRCHRHRTARPAQQVPGTSQVGSGPQQLWAKAASQSDAPVHFGDGSQRGLSLTSEAASSALPSTSTSPSIILSEQKQLCQGRGRVEHGSRGQEGQDGTAPSNFNVKSQDSPPSSLNFKSHDSGDSGSTSGLSADAGGSQKRVRSVSTQPADRTLNSGIVLQRSSPSLDKSTQTEVSLSAPQHSRRSSLSNDLDSENSLPRVVYE